MPPKGKKAGLGEVLLGSEQVTVVDVGAATGMHPRFRALRPNLRAVLFEPDKRSYFALVAERSDDAVHNCALDETDGTTRINLARKEQCSSFLMPRQELLRDFPEPERYDIEGTAEVETRSIDSVARDGPEIDFIKLDAQGAELRILRGATATLESVWGLEIEVEFTAIYQGQPLFSDVDPFVRARGFELLDLERYYWARTSVPDMARTSGQLVFADALYFKRQDEVERILSSIDWPSLRAGRFRRLLALLYVYRRNDYALQLLERLTASGLVELTAADRTALRERLLSNHPLALPAFKGRDRIGPRVMEGIDGLFTTRLWWRVDPDF